MSKRSSLMAILTLCLMCMACGGQTTGVTPASPPPPGNLPHSRADALAQLDALPVPAGVDARLFAEIKGTLKAMLEHAPPGKFTSTPPLGLQNRIIDLTTGIDDSGNKGIQWNYKNVGDYDLNSEVNISDITPIGVHFGDTAASADWKTAGRFADGDGNGEVNLADITPIGINFGHRVASYAVEGAATADGPFTSLDIVFFVAGKPIFTGMRMYHYLPAVQYPFYRVVPLDDLGARGEPSAPSVQFLISDKTRVVGAPGGPTFNSRFGDNLVLTLPDASPSPIVPGDVVVGSENGGYLLKVLDVHQAGTELDVTGTPGILADVFLQGGLSQELSDLSQVPPEVYTFDLSGQVLHDFTTLKVRIISGSVAFLPMADVAVNYNQYGGVTYLKGLALGGPLNLDMTVEIDAQGWDGTWPATPAETPFYEHKMTGFTFNFIAYQNGVPVTMALQYDIYVGTRGSGVLNGTYVARIISSYSDVKMGGIFNSRGTQDFNQYTPTHTNPGVPTISTLGGDFSFTVYVRPEIHTRLYGNPIPGNTEDLALTLGPQLTLIGTRTTDPEPGYNYELDGSMDTSYKLVLHHIGMDESPQIKNFTGLLDTVLAGFIPDFIGPG